MALSLAPIFAQSEEEKATYEYKLEKLRKEREEVREDEKEMLKRMVRGIEYRLEKKMITAEEAEKQKEEAAMLIAKNIEDRIAIIDRQIALMERNQGDYLGNPQFIEIGFGNESMDDANLIGIRIGPNKDQRRAKYDIRTRSDWVIAFGLNNAIIEGQSLEDSPYKVGGSRFFELGYQWTTRVFEQSNWLRFKYGLAFQFNGLKPEGNQVFVNENGTSELQVFETDLDKSKFRMDNLVIPIHFEFGPSRVIQSSKPDRIRYSLRKQFRLGLGGYGGLNLGSRQKIKYQDGSGHQRKEKFIGDFNTSNLIYGLSSYIGVGGTTLYVKYDLNPIFQDASVEQNNISIGLRFDY